MGEGQRERETQNLRQAPGSELSAQNPDMGLKRSEERRVGKIVEMQMTGFSFSFLCSFIYFERASVCLHACEGGGTDIESQAGSACCTIIAEPNAGLNLMNHEIIT